MTLLSIVPLPYRILAMAVFAAALFGFGYVKGLEHEKVVFDAFKAKVEEVGKTAQIEAKRVNDLHQKTLEDVSNVWKNQLQPARDGAVAAYIAAHPARVRDTSSSSGTMPGNAGRIEGNDAASKEQLPTGETCRPDDRFIQDAAEDALAIKTWQDWATKNGLPVK